jgi:hypothetical protein
MFKIWRKPGNIIHRTANKMGIPFASQKVFGHNLSKQWIASAFLLLFSDQKK